MIQFSRNGVFEESFLKKYVGSGYTCSYNTTQTTYEETRITSSSQERFVSSFASEMQAYPIPDGASSSSSSEWQIRGYNL